MEGEIRAARIELVAGMAKRSRECPEHAWNTLLNCADA
jgi:hypothetical protein